MHPSAIPANSPMNQSAETNLRESLAAENAGQPIGPEAVEFHDAAGQVRDADGVAIETGMAEEGFLHWLAREGRVALRWVMVVAAVVTVITMVSPMLWFAPFPAAVLLIAYVLLLFTNRVERHSDGAAHAALDRREVARDRDLVDDHTDDDQVARVPAAIIKRESMYGAISLGGVLVVALVYAAVQLPWEVFAIGAFVVFCYILMVAAPFWLGQFEDDIEIQQHRMEDRPEPAGVKSV